MHPNNIPFLDLKSQHAEIKIDLMRIMESAIDSAAFIGGEQVEKFESEFAVFCTGVEGKPLNCAAVGNGTDALRLALMALGIGNGDLVITVPNTFIATTEAISHTGARFAFVDVDAATSLMDVGLLAEELEKRFASFDPSVRPKAIVPVHLYGQCANMTEIMALAERYGIAVLEDAAQAHGAVHRGMMAGGMGHAAGFSFYPGKNLGACGDAGAVVSRSADLIDQVRMLRDHGQKTKYNHVIEGMNSRLDSIQAGFLRVKLSRLHDWNESRRTIAQRYDAEFASQDWLQTVGILPGNVPSRHLYVVHVVPPADRDALASVLKEQNIHTALHYPMPLHLQPCYEHLGYGRGAFPVAEKLARELISLPLFPGMTNEQIDRVVGAVKKFGRMQ